MKTGYFQDSDGNYSSMRLAFMILIAYAVASSSYYLYKKLDVAGAIALCTSIVTVAGTLKIIQNKDENKENGNKTSN